MHPAKRLFWTAVSVGLGLSNASSVRGDGPPSHRILPLPDRQVAFVAEDRRPVRWHFGRQYTRPFFHPFQGPSGESLTRIGHPGAENHDHHRSIWFAHHDVAGVNYWTEQTPARIRQNKWYCYRDGPEETVMACELGWYDGQGEGDGKERMRQELVAAVRSIGEGETLLEIQARFIPAGESIALGKTNFGFLAVRVAKHVSAYFGGGKLTNSEGAEQEPAVFGKRARWMDYSGRGSKGVEGITYFDHPGNPRYPSRWHVRADGWMGASFCMDEPYTITKGKPLVLRYLLHAHGGALDAGRAEKIAQAFAGRPGFEVIKAGVPHRQYWVRRIGGAPPPKGPDVQD